MFYIFWRQTLFGAKQFVICVSANTLFGAKQIFTSVGAKNVMVPNHCFAKYSTRVHLMEPKSFLAPTDVHTRRTIFVPEWSSIQFSTMVDLICSRLERRLWPISQLETGANKIVRAKALFGAKTVFGDNKVFGTRQVLGDNKVNGTKQLVGAKQFCWRQTYFHAKQVSGATIFLGAKSFWAPNNVSASNKFLVAAKLLVPANVLASKKVFPEQSCILFSTMVVVICSLLEGRLWLISQVETCGFERFRKLEWPFTPKHGSIGFRRFPTFHSSTPKTQTVFSDFSRCFSYVSL